MPIYEIEDPQTGRVYEVEGPSPPSGAQIRSIIAGASSKPAERTWGDTFTDALPLAGGVVGGALGVVAGIPGIMAGSAIGGGLGEAARQTARGEDLDYGDIATTGLAEGATAGAFGLAGKGATRLIRGVQRAKISPRDIATGIAKAPFTHGPIGAVKRSIEETSANRLKREALGSGQLKGRVEKLDDILLDALKEARTAPPPAKIGGVGKPFRSKAPALSGERTGDLIATQPDKWGMTSLHTPDRVEDALRAPQGQLRTSNRASDFMLEKRAASLPQAAPMPAAQRATLADDAVGRYTRGNPQQQELLRELLRAQDELAAREGTGRLTNAGRSMLTPDDELRFQRALRIAR